MRALPAAGMQLRDQLGFVLFALCVVIVMSLVMGRLRGF
jgi:hypothetical protein